MTSKKKQWHLTRWAAHPSPRHAAPHSHCIQLWHNKSVRHMTWWMICPPMWQWRQARGVHVVYNTGNCWILDMSSHTGITTHAANKSSHGDAQHNQLPNSQVHHLKQAVTAATSLRNVTNTQHVKTVHYSWWWGSCVIWQTWNLTQNISSRRYGDTCHQLEESKCSKHGKLTDTSSSRRHSNTQGKQEKSE